MSKLHLSIVCFEMYKKNAFREYLILSLKFKWDFVLINSRFTLGHNLICVQTELSKLTLASVRNSQNVSFYSINMHGVAWNLFNEKWKMNHIVRSFCILSYLSLIKISRCFGSTIPWFSYSNYSNGILSCQPRAIRRLAFQLDWSKLTFSSFYC